MALFYWVVGVVRLNFWTSSYYREIVTTEKNLLGVCMLFVFLYDLVIIDESIRISKNDKFFILVKVAEYPIF